MATLRHTPPSESHVARSPTALRSDRQGYVPPRTAALQTGRRDPAGGPGLSVPRNKHSQKLKGHGSTSESGTARSDAAGTSQPRLLRPSQNHEG